MALLPEGRRSIAAYAYQVGPGNYYKPAYRFIAADVGVDSGAWLDIGTGPGWLAIYGASGRPDLDVIGIDTSSTMIEIANTNKQGRLNVTNRVMDGADIIYPQHTFDVITAVQVAHEWADPAKVLSECWRTLKVGGKLYIYEADPDAEIPGDWIQRRGALPTDAMLKKEWRTNGMDQAKWDELRAHVAASPFGAEVVDERHGPFRRLVCTRA